MIDDQELEARRARFALVLAAQAADEARMAEIAQITELEATRRPEGLAILRTFLAEGDLNSFRTAMDRWSRLPQRTSFSAFGGLSGQMFLNQLVNVGDNGEVGPLLRRVLTVPEDEAAAAAAIDELVAFCERVKRAGNPAPGRVSFMLTFFWSLANHDRWPVAWMSAMNSLTAVGWLGGQVRTGAEYLRFREVILSLGKPGIVEAALRWWDEHPFVGLDPALVDRLQRADAVDRGRTADEAYVSEEDRLLAEREARTCLGELKLLGRALEDRLAKTLGRSVKMDVPSIIWTPGRFRADAWVQWAAATIPGKPSLRVWATVDGVFVGLHPGHPREGWYPEAASALAGLTPDGVALFPVRYSGAARLPVDPGAQPGGEFLMGRWFPDALGRSSFADDVVALAVRLKPALDKLAGLMGDAPPVGGDGDPLTARVAEFKERYPSERDLEYRAKREQMAARLAHDELLASDLSEIQWMWNSNVYGNPGPQSRLNAKVRDASPKEQEQILRSFDYLLWGPDPEEVRINRLLDPDDLGTPGLGESVIVKLLSIVHADRWVPIFPYTGQNGKRHHLPLLGLAPPDSLLSRGELQVRSNDLIRRRLDPLFPNDPWGMGQFLYWLGTRPQVPVDDVDPLAALAEELLVERADLEELVALLEDKRQIILYGPPGTGKTHLARRLGAVLAGDPVRCMIVQFHPSLSYEDFFEGYRPRITAEGQLGYELRQGPLALLAEQATAAPSVPHVLVIDEINRANLPKVFGELLFLLEYRNEQVRVTYRPDQDFALPDNLWLIGTMNTADRSIALVDAALRRRFHFVPFFPNEGIMAGLLRRWLVANAPGAAWIADLVDMVNAELIDDLGGPHLQIGPSHFMVKGIDDVRLEKIWRYDIMPFIEDQLFGEPAKIRKYRFEVVRNRFHEQVPVPEGEDEYERADRPQ
jgi:5-methylcytosine-specific restriction enzyme B